MSTKPYYASKTFWFNTFTIIWVGMTALGWQPDLQFAEEVSNILLGLAPIVNLILRFFTNKGIRI
jgi:Na+/alanine symporter